MNILPLSGDIVDLARDHAEAIILWLRDGYRMRAVTWGRVRREYPDLRAEDHVADVNAPWRSPRDTLWSLYPRTGRTRLAYTFANSAREGYATLDEVENAVARSLVRLTDLGIRQVAYIHVPFSPLGGPPTGEQCREAAQAMVDAMRAWDAENPGRIDVAYLVDLYGAFNWIADAEGEPILR